MSVETMEARDLTGEHVGKLVTVHHEQQLYGVGRDARSFGHLGTRDLVVTGRLRSLTITHEHPHPHGRVTRAMIVVADHDVVIEVADA